MKKFKKLFEKFLYLYFFITLFIFLIFSYFVYESYNLSKNNYLNNKFAKRFILAYRETPFILIGAFHGFFEKTNTINIRIDNDNLKKIEEARILAKKNKRLNNTIAKKSSVNAEIHSLAQKAELKKIKIRLKGDRPTHFIQEKNSSYKINLSNNDFFLNFNEFGIHKPRARNYIYEWIFHKIMDNENILGPKYEFVNLRINNNKKGLYALEESLDNLIFTNKNIGPIIFVPDDLINSVKLKKKNNYEVFYIDKRFSLKRKNYWNNDKNKEVKNRAFDKLHKFLNKEINLSQTFDIDSIAKYMALTDLLMTYHGYSIANIRFHYNPKSQLFEFVAWDGHRKNARYHPWNKLYDPSTSIELMEQNNNSLSHLRKNFFWDENDYKLFLKSYYREIKRITDKKYLDTFFRNNKNQINTYNNLIYKDYFFTDNFDRYGPSFYYFDSNELYIRADYLAKKYF